MIERIKLWDVRSIHVQMPSILASTIPRHFLRILWSSTGPWEVCRTEKSDILGRIVLHIFITNSLGIFKKSTWKWILILPFELYVPNMVKRKRSSILNGKVLVSLWWRVLPISNFYNLPSVKWWWNVITWYLAEGLFALRRGESEMRGEAIAFWPQNDEKNYNT